MSIWEPIFNKLSESKTSLVYFAIGSALGYHQQITEANNQQYPCFLDKFAGSKVVILIDPELEYPLKVESYFSDKGQPLITNKTLEFGCSNDLPESKHDCNNVNKSPYVYRHLSNSEIDIYALNISFNFQHYQWTTLTEAQQIDHDIALMINMLSICLGKVKKTKVILQDYTGRDVNHFYVSLFNTFDKKELLANVLFDVTQKDGGCFIDLKPSMAQTDSDGNFTQERYSKLSEHVRSPFYDQILRTRIDVLNYPLSYHYFKLSESPLYDFDNPERLDIWFAIYNMRWESSNKDPEYRKNKFGQLIKVMIDDIVESRQCETELKEYLVQNVCNRSTFINTLSILKFE